MLTMADKGGREVRQMLTLADKGGEGFWLLMISLTKLLKITKYIGFSQTHLDIFIIWVKNFVLFLQNFIIYEDNVLENTDKNYKAN